MNATTLSPARQINSQLSAMNSYLDYAKSRIILIKQTTNADSEITLQGKDYDRFVYAISRARLHYTEAREAYETNEFTSLSYDLIDALFQTAEEALEQIESEINAP